MGKGFLSGILWGSVSGVAVLAVLSLYTPLSADRSEELLREAETSEDQALLGTGELSNKAQDASVEPVKTSVASTNTAPVEANNSSEQADQSGSVTAEDAPVLAEQDNSKDEPETAVEDVVIVEVTPSAPKPQVPSAEQESEQAETVAPASVSDDEDPDVLVVEAPKTKDDDRPIGIVIYEPEDKAPEVQSDAPAVLANVAPATPIKPKVERVVEIDAAASPAISAAPATQLSDSIGQTPIDPAIDPATPGEPSSTIVSESTAPDLEGDEAIEIATAPQPIPVNVPAAQILPGQEGTTAPLIEITQGSPNRSTLPRIEPQPAPSEEAPDAQPEADEPGSSANQPITIGVPATPRASTGVVTGRLPSLGGSAANPTTPAAIQRGDALRTYAADPVPGTGEGGVMSVVLIDKGEGGMAIEQLTDLAFPYSVAIDPTAPDAGERAAMYRAAGIEVLALPADIPQSASASDVAVAMASYFVTLPEAVAVLDTIDGKLQSNRGLLTPVLGVLQETGHALVTFSRGLNSAQQAARRAEVESGAVFRVLDDAGESGMTIKRTLDRAGFNAARDGSVILLGHTYMDTVTTILEWSLDAKSTTLSMVPVSQILIGAPSS